MIDYAYEENEIPAFMLDEDARQEYTELFFKLAKEHYGLHMIQDEFSAQPLSEPWDWNSSITVDPVDLEKSILKILDENIIDIIETESWEVFSEIDFLTNDGKQSHMSLSQLYSYEDHLNELENKILRQKHG